MMDVFGHPDPLVAGCAVPTVLAFVAREVVAGLLRAAGGDPWAWLKRCRARSYRT